MDLDLKDRKIVYELDKNSRQSASQIGKLIGLSPEVTNYRIKRLESENIITQYQLITNLSALGIYQFKICLALQHTTSKELDQTITNLKKQEHIKWIVQTKGNWDILIAAETKDFNEINNLKNSILEQFQNKIREKALSILVEADTYNRNYLLKDSQNTTRLIMKRSPAIEIDKLDYQILHSLAENARKPLLAIAQELHQSSRTIYYRIKQLEKKKIILGYKIAINYEKLKVKFYKTFIYLNNPKENRIKLIKATLENHPNVTHNVEVFSSWDLEPEFETVTEEEFNNIINKIKDDFSDIIKKIDIITITKEHKFVYF